MDDRDPETGLPFNSGTDTAVERWLREYFHSATALGFPMAAYVSERDTQRRLQDSLAEAKSECGIWRRAAEAEAQGDGARSEMVRRCSEVLAELERRARAAERTAVADIYCTLWDAHGLLEDALNLTTTTPDRTDGSGQ